MPFYGHTDIPDPDVPDKAVAGTIRKWLVTVGEFTSPEQRIATVDVAGSDYGLVTCFPAFIDCLHAPEGSTVPADGLILKWIADGESIPYGRTYFRLENEAG